MSFQLRWYQKEAVAAVHQAWKEGDRATLVHMATGLGKTVVMAKVISDIRNDGARVLFLAHLSELLDGTDGKGGALGAIQSYRRWDRYHFERNVEKVTDYEIATGKPDVVLAMVQSLHGRLGRYPPDFFSHIVIDEGHHAAALTYRKIMDHFAGAKIATVTATPERADKIGLEFMFGAKPCYTMDITDGIADGWLVEPSPKSVRVESLDWSGLKEKGEWTDGEIETVTNNDKTIHEIAAGLVDQAPKLSTIVFMPGVESAHRLAAYLRKGYQEAADVVDKDTDPLVRRDILERFKRGDLLRLVNIGCFTEGFDAPIIRCVAVCRPTRHVSKYLQMIGRGTRPYPPRLVDEVAERADRMQAIADSAKPNVLLLDFEGNLANEQLRPVRGRDVMRGKLPHGDYGGLEQPSEANVALVDERFGDSLSIHEVRQRAADEQYLKDLLEGKIFKAAAKAKHLDVQDFASFFTIPPPKRPTNFKTYEDKVRERKQREEREALFGGDPNTATPAQIRYIYVLHKMLGKQPPADGAFWNLTKKKAGKWINDLKEQHQKQGAAN